MHFSLLPTLRVTLPPFRAGTQVCTTSAHDRPPDRQPVPRVVVLSNLGRMSWKQGDLAAAQDLAEKTWPLRALHGCRWRDSHALLILGTAKCDQRQFSTAQTALEEALSLSRKDGRNGRVMAYCLDALGRVALIQGRRADARQQLAESLRLWLELGEQAKVAGLTRKSCTACGCIRTAPCRVAVGRRGAQV